MSQNGNIPKQGLADPFDGEPFDRRRFDGESEYWSLSDEDRAAFDAYRLECCVAWQIEAEIEAKAAAAVRLRCSPTARPSRST